MGRLLGREVEGGAQRLPGHGLGGEEGTALPLVVHGHDGGAPGAEELFVVPLLQAGDADVVTGLDPSLTVLDQLGGGRPDRPEDRGGEVLGGGEWQPVGDRTRAGDAGEVAQHLCGRVVATVDDRLDVGLGPGGHDLLEEPAGVDVDQPGERPRR